MQVLVDESHSLKSKLRSEIKKGCSWTIWTLSPKHRKWSETQKMHTLLIYRFKNGRNSKLAFLLPTKESSEMCLIAMTTVYLHVFLAACYRRLSFPGTCCLCCWRLNSSSLAARAWASAWSSCSWGLEKQRQAENPSAETNAKDQLRGYCHVSVLTLNLGESYLKKMQVVFKGYASELFLDCALALGEQHTVFFLRKGLM